MKRTSESNKKRSERLKALWQDPDYREKQLSALHKRWEGYARKSRPRGLLKPRDQWINPWERPEYQETLKTKQKHFRERSYQNMLLRKGLKDS